jgi:purine-nucleoside phosphorylase
MKKLKEAVEFLRGKGISSLKGAISTGSGQPLISERMKAVFEISQGEIPGMKGAMIPGHEGKLRVIESGDCLWTIWVGRKHFYQGYTYEDIGYYIDISQSLGAEHLLCVNASGGMNPDYKVGDFVAIEKFRNFIPLGNTPVQLDGGSLRQASEVINRRLLDASEKCGFTLRTGNYAGVPGPTYETESDVKWLRKLSCDVVGMSTTPELSRSLELGMNVSALSVVTNTHTDDTDTTHEEVLRGSKAVEKRLSSLIDSFIVG